MTQADQIKAAYNREESTFEELLDKANEISVEEEQDYENETSQFVFDDGSILQFDGICGDIRTRENK